MTRKKLLLLILLIIPLGLVFVLSQLPVTDEVEKRIAQTLENAGFSDVTLDVSGITTSQIRFSSMSMKRGDITIYGNDVHFIATNLPYREVLRGDYSKVVGQWEIGEIRLSGLPQELPPLAGKGDFRMEEGYPAVTGHWQDKTGSYNGDFEVTNKNLVLENVALPMDDKRLTVDEVMVSFPTTEQPVGSWQVSLLEIKNLPSPVPPLSGSGTYQLPEEGMVLANGNLHDDANTHTATFKLAEKSLDVTNVKFALEKTYVAIASLSLGFANQEAIQEGSWKLSGLAITGLDQEVPVLQGSGNYDLDKKRFVSGNLQDKSKQYMANIRVNEQEAIIRNLRLKWEGATIKSAEIHIPFGGEKSFALPLHIEQLPLNTLFSNIAQGKASGSGMISGDLDLSVDPKGGVSLKNGNFVNNAEGVIKIDPSALPGEQAQMKIAREALSNFHYTKLSLTTSGDKEQGVTIKLNVEGNNPQAFNGRPVKLNVNLTGDVIELLEQTILPLTDPMKYIAKEK